LPAFSKVYLYSSFQGHAKKVGGDSSHDCYPVLAYRAPFAYKDTTNISKLLQFCWIKSTL